MMDPFYSHAPGEYAEFLRQIPGKELKAMQQAFLSGTDLTPFVLENVMRSFEQGGQYPDHTEILAAVTTAVCWSLVAPEILKVQKTVDPAMVGPKPVVGAAARGGRVPSGPFDSVVQGEFCDLPGWMMEWKGSAEHQNMIKTAISTPAHELACDKHGVSVMGHAQFGLKRVGRASTAFDRSLPHYFRTLVVSNESSEPAVLVDICGIPSIHQVFVLHDDYGLAHHYGIEQSQQTSVAPHSSRGVILQAGAQYQVTVELRCSEQDIALHMQWLLFMFGSGTTLQGNKKQEIFVIGRCVSALIGQNIQDVQKCLSTEAKPFYPAYLRGLFDSQPLSFEVAKSSKIRAFRYSRTQVPAYWQTHLVSIWPFHLYSLQEALQVGALYPSSHNTTRRCGCTAQQLRQLSGMIALEEAAMEWDIKEFDLFNVQLIHLKSSNFLLEVPGLPENRPSVFVDDVVYIRLERYPGLECAAEVVALEFQPTPRLILDIPPAFLMNCPRPPVPVVVHVRFTFDRLFLIRMHRALQKLATSSAFVLPCICIKGVKDDRRDLPVSLDISSNFALTRINKSLNMEQWKAVTNVVDKVHGPGPYIILGPPGTGKTVTVVECVLQVLSADPLARLCVCAPSNYAADILCSGIAAGGIDPSQIWRMNDPRRTIASVKVDVVKFCNFGLLSRASDEKLAFKVIVCTCGAAGMLNEDPLSGRMEALTHIFIDEAGQALIPEAWIPLSLGNSNTTYVLCGDPKQLGPVVHSKLAAENGFDDTLIARFAQAEESRLGSGRTDSSPVTKLLRNYRANGKLLELPSRLFYNNELIASAEASTITPPKDWDELDGRDFPMLFYGVSGQQMREGESPSYFNAVEAGKVVELICGLISKTQITAGDIGVMAPYRRQVQKLRLLLRSKQLGAVRVGTVDDYQGQEEKVVFISTVITRPESLKQVQTSGRNRILGFLSNAKRFNVAITRAKALLVVVGHPLVLSLDENWSELLRYCLARDAFRGYGSDAMSRLIPTEQSTTDDHISQIGLQDSEEISTLEALEMANAIEKMAELSLLGMGDRDRLYPIDLDSMYSAFSEDLEWRIRL